MAPVIVTTQPRTIVITPNMFVGDENRKIIDNGELPKYAVGLFESNGPGPRKRKRLTHLTPEEKVMRRKLKNRVAAQTARDRKKARLETLEETVAKIHEQTKKLLDVNSQLLERTEALERENEVLRERLGLDVGNSFTQEKRRELNSIKQEFNEIVSAQNISSQNTLQDCSDDESYCILTPYEGNDNSVGNRSLIDVSPCEASKCRSPEPAAGSCQPSEADPLASQTGECIDEISVTDSGITESSQGDSDLANLLKELEAIQPEQCSVFNNSAEGNAIGSTEAIVSHLLNANNKITVPLNVFRDHGYSKSNCNIVWSQGVTSDVVVPVAESSIINNNVQEQSSIDSNKSIALVEEPQNCMQQQSELKVPCEHLNSIIESPCTNNAKEGNEPQTMDLSNIDSVFDNWFTNLSESAENSESESVDSGVSSCESPMSASFLDTPSPLSVSGVDPFDAAMDCNFWDDQLATDLFPQLVL
uniref:uncharacterized protein LOC120342950 isoform X3 n=1 Tax=Styela clava TaxID=7725 RepID=UPI0019397C25|nr:uncharacterized protein LOC120342950 isoform X3 [Styela clava]